MSYRYYDDTPARGSRKADPSIDAWFRELRGDAAPAELRSSASASRQRQRDIDAETATWQRGEEPRRQSRLADPWDIDTGAWTPDWDTNATSYLPRAAARPAGPVARPMPPGPRHEIAAAPPRERRPTGDQPRIVERRPTGDQPRIAERRTGDQPRIAERRPEPGMAERRSTGEQARTTEGRSAEIRDLNEARELREARGGRPVPSRAASQPVPARRDFSQDSYDTTYDDLPAYHQPAVPAPAPARTRTPAASLGPAASAPLPNLPAQPAPAIPPAPSPAPAYVPAPAAPSPAPSYVPAPAAYSAAPVSSNYTSSTYGSSAASGGAHRAYAAMPAFGGSGYEATGWGADYGAYPQGALAAAPAYADQRHDQSGYAASTDYTGSRLPEPRHADSQFDVVLPDSSGEPVLAFKNGQWFRCATGGMTGSPITVRSAVLEHAELAGSVVQILCWWMRENSRRERALDIATELALAVTELTHMAEIRQKTPAFY